MKRESSIYTVVSIVATVLFLLSTSFLLCWDSSQTLFQRLGDNVALSSVVSILAFAFISFLLSYVNLRCFSYSPRSILLYGTYLIMILVIPGSLIFSQYHIAAMLVIWAIMYMFKFVVYEKLKYSHLFQAILCVSTASVLVPELLLYLLLFVFFGFGRREYNGLRIFYTIAGALILPWVYLLSISFLFEGPSAGEIVEMYCASLSNVSPSISSLTISGVVYYSALLLIILRAMLYFRSLYAQRNRAQRVSINFSLALSVASLVLIGFYFNPNNFMLAIPLFVSFTFSIFDYFKNGRKGEARLAFTLLCVMAVMYRVSLLLEVL